MLIVACQICGNTRILSGFPDSDGMARATWTCSKCGTGQLLQIPVSSDATGYDLKKIVNGLPRQFFEGK
ncbi:MAG: alcohol dehydrogenase [Synergistales bacterium]|nr:alcohol dehydrogenase [Synergistales bacterium]